MILPFSTKFADGSKTCFVRKIWDGLHAIVPDYDSEKLFYAQKHFEKFNQPWDGLNRDIQFPKIHTIRHDVHDRWKPGMKIHAVIFNRSKQQFQFAPVLVCKSTQRIEIIYYDTFPVCVEVKVDGLSLTRSEILTLAINDGFAGIVSFWNFFNKSFSGKIIHWTECKY